MPSSFSPQDPQVFSKSELADALGCGKQDLAELQELAKQLTARPLPTDPRQQLEKQRLFRRDEEDGPLSRGRWVRVDGLKATQINGREGMVVQTAKEDGGRVGVELARFGAKLIKPENLWPLPYEETVKVARLFARGETHAGAFTWRWPPRELVNRPFELSKMSAALGVPLNVVRLEPERDLRSTSDFDNDWLAHLMLDPKTGSVQSSWSIKPGPVVVWRADGGDLSADDVCLLVCFIDTLLPKYADKENPIDVDEEVTPEMFQSFKAREMALDSYYAPLFRTTEDGSIDNENELREDRTQWWESINI